jgi:hypothetical protein
MPNHQPGNLEHVLAGMAYPATYWQILAWADYNCATSKLRKALWQLPDKTYVNQRAILAALWEQPGGAVASYITQTALTGRRQEAFARP